MPTPSGFPTSQDLINAQKDVEHLGRVVNSEDAQGNPIASSTNRTGGTNKTLDALQTEYQSEIDDLDDQADTLIFNKTNEFNAAIRNAGGEPLGDGVYAAGKTYTAYNQYLIYNGVEYKPRTTTTLPYTTQGGDPTVSPDADNLVPYKSEIDANSVTLVFNTVADLKAAPVVEGQSVRTLGYYNAGDGGGCVYRVVASGTATSLGFLFEKLDNGLEAELISGGVIEDKIVKIPTDYATLQSAVDFLSIMQFSAEVEITLLIESGHALTTGLRVVGGDYANISIRSEDSTVGLSLGFVPVDSSPVPESAKAIFYFENCVTPSLSCLIDANDNFGFDGLICYRNSELNVDEGCGVRGTRMNLEVRASKIFAKYTHWDRSARGCIRLTDNTQFTISGSSCSHSWVAPPPGQSSASAALHISRSSIGQAQSLTINDSGFRPITVRRSRVYLDGTVMNNSGLSGGSNNTAIEPMDGATVVLGSVTFNSQPLQPDNCRMLAFNTSTKRGIVYSRDNYDLVDRLAENGASSREISILGHTQINIVRLDSISLNNTDVTFNVNQDMGDFSVAYICTKGTRWMSGTGVGDRLRAVNSLVVGCAGGVGRIRMADPNNNALDETIDLQIVIIGNPLHQ